MLIQKPSYSPVLSLEIILDFLKIMNVDVDKIRNEDEEFWKEVKRISLEMQLSQVGIWTKNR